MALKSFISPKDLKTTFISKNVGPCPLSFSFSYDNLADELMISFISPDKETVVHYLDDHIGLLLESETNEIVGFQIDAFNSSFLPKYASLQKIWRLKDCKEFERENVGELSLAVHERQVKITQEIIHVCEPKLGKQAKPLEKALIYA
jgi:hypothetical protein